MKNLLSLTEAAAEFIPTKLRAKCRVPWESLIVEKKRDKLTKILSERKKKNPTNANE